MVSVNRGDFFHCCFFLSDEMEVINDRSEIELTGVQHL